MNNFEFVKNMNIEELAEFMNLSCPPVAHGEDYCIPDCMLCWKTWFSIEHEE